MTSTQLNAWLKQTVTVAAVTGRTSYGDPTFGTKTAVSARVQPVARLIRTPNGDEALTSSVVYVTSAVGYADRLWLPGANTADNTAASVPLKIETEVNKSGQTVFYKVWL